MNARATDRRQDRLREIVLPIAAFVATIAAALWLRDTIRAGEQRLLVQRTALALEVGERTLESGLRQRVAALARLGQRMSLDAARPAGDDARNEKLFRAGARQFIVDFPGLVAVGWQAADDDAVLVESSGAPFGDRLAASAARTRVGAGEPALSIDTSGHEALAQVDVPSLDESGRAAGRVLATYRLSVLVDDLLTGLPGGYEMRIRAGDRVVYARPPAPTSPGRTAGASHARTYFGQALAVDVWPAARTRAVFMSGVPQWLLVAGFAIATLFALTLRFSALARTRARQAEGALARLEHEAHERERVQETLERAHEALKHRNEELRDFAFAASHDLQEPLRKIRAFGDRLKAKYADRLEDTGRDYLERMQGAAGRMQQLIEALLEYSRIANNARPQKAVDLNQVAHDVVADLETTIEHARGEVILGALPVIVADPVHMRQLLQNLIANGLKFRAPGRDPVVRVTAYPIVRDGQPWCRLLVEDNGIGFEMQYAERIFAPFKRLHARDEFEGTGIGLAIVRRIVERHHGTVAATGRAGEGATFTVELPAGGEAASSAPSAG